MDNWLQNSSQYDAGGDRNMDETEIGATSKNANRMIVAGYS